MAAPGALGPRGEEAAAAWYRAAGYEVLARNWRCREGELDLVLRSAGGEVLVFCEVKTRSSDRFGSPFEAVTPAKQRRLRRLAGHWLRTADVTCRAAGRRLRFDVAAVRSAPDGTLAVEVLEDAF